jgi:hypothetical protein
MTQKLSKATQAELSDLHAELARTLKKGLGIRDENGAPIAAICSVARQFLKDNKIEVDAAPPGSAMRDLADDLPVFDDDLPATAGPAH